MRRAARRAGGEGPQDELEDVPHALLERVVRFRGGHAGSIPRKVGRRQGRAPTLERRTDARAEPRRSRGHLTVFVGAAADERARRAVEDALRRDRLAGRDALDVEAIVRRRPEVCAVEDPAGANPAGARHARRWQDIEELLDEGIDVYTAVDVTRIESLRDVVTRVAGAPAGGALPDAFLARATDVRFVDGAPDAPASGEGAGPRAALRELALRFTAERADAAVTAFRDEHAVTTTWPVRERVVVGVSPSPASQALLRGAATLARRLGAPLVAVHVGPPRGLADDARARLEENLALAERLGAELVVTRDDDAAGALVREARARNATRIVVGKPTHARLRDRVRASFLDAVVRGSDEIEVHVMAGGDAPETRPRDASPASRPAGAAWVPGLAVAGITLLALALDGGRHLTDVAMAFVAATLLVALRHGRRAAVGTAVLSVASYDFFFVPPVHTLAVGDLHHVLTLGVLLGVGLVTSELTSRLRAEVDASRRAEAVARRRETLARALARASSVADVAAAAEGAFAPHRTRVWAASSGAAEALGEAHGALRSSGPLDEAAAWVAAHGRPAGRGSGTLPEAPATCLPLVSSGPVEGVLALAPAAPDDRAARREVEAACTLLAQALERLRLEGAAERARLAAETELMRSNVISSVSHDLRTPLAVLTGAATALESPGLGAEGRSALVASLVSESARLDRLVKNLLDMTRIEAGAVRARLEPVPVVELVGSALAREAGRLADAGLAVTTRVDATLVASVDPVLVEQVLVNLLDNARRHAGGATRLTLAAEADEAAPEHRVRIVVEDDGPGFAPGSEARVFERFYRAEAGRGGTGLGLAICKGLVEAQGGRVHVERGAEGARGARIVVELTRAHDLDDLAELDPPASRADAAPSPGGRGGGRP